MESLDALWRRLTARTDYERCRRPRAARFDLVGMEALCRRLGRPERAVPALHLAGSKGKGSTAGFLERGLRAAGLRTGLYLSPHLEDWRERIQIDGRPAPDPALAAALASVLAAAAGGETFFDLLTVAAFLVFRDQGCEAAVIETGLGGRADSTNVLRPLAAIVTSIEREHTEVLGDSLEAIAGEKAGIFKAGAACWSGLAPGHPAASVLRRAAAAVGEELHELPESLGLRADLPFPQPHMRRNHALARAVLAGLGGRDPRFAAAAAALDRLPADELRQAGRWEERTATDGRTVLFDVAHSPDSLRAVLACYRTAFADRNRGVVLGLRDDKDPAALAAALAADPGPAPAGEAWFACPAGDHPRSASPEVLAAAFGPAFRAAPLPKPLLPAGPEVLLVTGSTYLVGALRPLTAVKTG